MTIKTLMTTFVLVATSAAIAEPVRGYDERYDERPDREREAGRDDDRDQHRGRDRDWQRGGLSRFSPPQIDRRQNLSQYVGPIGRVDPRWGFVPITAPTRIETVRESFDLTQAGRIGTVRLEAVRGTTRITQLGIVYGNGEREFIPVNETIGRRNPTTYDLDLRGRGRTVTILNVYGESSPGSAYRILATR